MEWQVEVVDLELVHHHQAVDLLQHEHLQHEHVVLAALHLQLLVAQAHDLLGCPGEVVALVQELPILLLQVHLPLQNPLPPRPQSHQSERSPRWCAQLSPLCRARSPAFLKLVRKTPP